MHRITTAQFGWREEEDNAGGVYFCKSQGFGTGRHEMDSDLL